MVRTSIADTTRSLPGRTESAGEDEYAARQVSRILGRFRTREAVPALAESLGSENVFTFLGAVSALSAIGDELSSEVLLDRFPLESGTRQSVIEELVAEIRAPEAMSALQAALVEKSATTDTKLRLACLKALTNLPRDRVYEQIRILAETDPEPNVRQFAKDWVQANTFPP